MAEYSFYTPNQNLENTIERFIRGDFVTEHDLPDYLKTHLNFAFDEDERWGVVTCELYIANHINITQYGQVPSEEVNNTLVCVATCQSNGITFVRTSYFNWAGYGSAIVIAKTLSRETLNTLYSELVKEEE